MEKLQEEKKVDYIELFFDLIFVYTFRTVNALVTHGDRFPSLSKMALFYFLLLVALQIWYLTTMYYNRFGRRSFLDYGSLLLNMYFLFYMGTSMEKAFLEHYTRYHLAFAAVFFNLAHLCYRRSKECNEPSGILVLRTDFRNFFLEAVLVLLSIPFYYHFGLILSPIALLFGYIARFFMLNIFSKKMVDFAHLSERALLLVILTFGESIISISSYFHHEKNFFFNISSFAIVVGMFLHYAFFYDNVLNHKRSSTGQFYILLHVLFILCLNTITVAFELFIKAEKYFLPSTVLFALALLGFYACLLGMNHYAKPVYQSHGTLIKVGIGLMALYILSEYLYMDNPLRVSEITTMYVYTNLFVSVYLYLKKTGKRFVIGHDID